MHKIDLSKYEVRTDMIVDLLDEETSKLSNETLEDGVKISWMKLDEDNPFNKKSGNYLTILFDDVTDSDARLFVSKSYYKGFIIFLISYLFKHLLKFPFKYITN